MTRAATIEPIILLLAITRGCTRLSPQRQASRERSEATEYYKKRGISLAFGPDDSLDACELAAELGNTRVDGCYTGPLPDLVQRWLDEAEGSGLLIAHSATVWPGRTRYTLSPEAKKRIEVAEHTLAPLPESRVHRQWRARKEKAILVADKARRELSPALKELEDAKDNPDSAIIHARCTDVRRHMARLEKALAILSEPEPLEPIWDRVA